MPILPIDGGRYGTKEMREIFDEEKKIQYQLEIEATAAESQAEVNMIPKDVAQNIAKMARSGKVTSKRIKNLEAKSDHDTAALVEALSELCKPTAKPWVLFFFKQKTAYDIGLGIPAEPLFRSRRNPAW